MESIREVFKDKEFSEEELNYLENAINEFDEVFGDFVSREELIERTKSTIDKIEFTEHLDSTRTCAIGCYVLEYKKIQVLKNLEVEKLGSVFFHEFLHAIVSDGRNTGFDREYQAIDFDEEIKFRFGIGWNEGFVQMMTQERDKKVANKVVSKGYPILTESVTRFANLLGRNELIDLYLNHADKFAEFMREKTDSLGETFLMNFDVIHKYEREIYTKKVMGRLYSAIFGEEKKRDINNDKLKRAQEEIMQIYIDALMKDRIESHTELQDTLNNISEMYRVFSKTISVYTIQRIIEQSNPDILGNLEGLEWETQLLVNSGIEFKKFMELDTSEKIKMLMKDDCKAPYCDLYCNYPSLEEEYYSSIVTELYERERDFGNEDLSEWISYFAGVAQYIDKNNLSFENLKIAYNNYQNRAVFELYNLQEKGEYEKVSTLFVDDDIGIYDTIEYTQVEGEKLAELREQISKEYSIEIIEAVEDGNGNYIVYDDNGQVFVSTEFNEMARSQETKNFESVNELKLENIKKKIENMNTRLRKMQEIQTPALIIQHEREILEKALREKKMVFESIRNATRKKITPSQIEAETINGNVTVQSLQNTIEDLSIEGKILENEGEDLNVK